MDPDLAALSSAAAATLVTLITTDSWEQLKATFVRLWRRNPQDAGAVEADLAAARLKVMAARRAGDEQAEAAVAAEWQSRLGRLVAVDQLLQGELRQLVEELRPMPPGIGQGVPVVMHATASDSGRVYQAGRDQTITGR